MTIAAATTAASSSQMNSIMQNYLTKQTANVAADKTAAASPSAQNGLASATSASAIGSNFNTFINILTTQLKNQDPTSATDPNQFTQELVQFAGVEQQLNTNNDLQTLINLTKGNSGVNAAINYMGQYIEAPANGQLALQSGKAELGYTLTSAAQNVTISVQDSTGKTVATLSGATTKGLDYVTWNGKDASGNQLPDGAYTFRLAATNPDGSAQKVTDTRVVGQVTSVTSNSDGTANLSLGTGLSLATSSVDTVFNATNIPAATTTGA